MIFLSVVVVVVVAVIKRLPLLLPSAVLLSYF